MSNKSQPRLKRRLLEEETEWTWKKRRANVVSPKPSSIYNSTLQLDNTCARLEITTESRAPEIAFLRVNEALTMGRHPTSDICVESTSVSRCHCKFYAIRAGVEDGGVIISCRVSGRNGVLWNGQSIRSGSTIILLDEDYIEVNGPDTYCKLTCYHNAFSGEDNTRRQPPNKSIHTSKRGATPATAPKMIDRFSVGDHVLGAGSHATVRLAVDTSTQCQVACKSILLPKGRFAKNEVLKEVKILRSLCHANINGILHSISSSTYLHMFLELCSGGDLHAWLNAQSASSEPESRYIGYQLMLGLEYLHSNRIAHRDLKPENILLHAPGRFPRVLIADFGFSRTTDKLSSHSVAGTPNYMPPEAVRAVYQARPIDLVIADCWSFGAVLFQMLTRTRLFDHDIYECDDISESFGSGLFSKASLLRGKQKRSLGGRKVTHDADKSPLPSNMDSIKLDLILAERIMRADVPYDSRIWRDMPDARWLVSRLLCKNPSARCTMKEALASSWIIKDLSMLEKRYRINVLATPDAR